MLDVGLRPLLERRALESSYLGPRLGPTEEVVEDPRDPGA